MDIPKLQIPNRGHTFHWIKLTHPNRINVNGTTNPVYYQNTTETVSLDNLPTGQISWNTWQYLWSPQLSTRDAEYLNRLWREETATAFTDAKKYAAKKAQQWKTAAERLKLKKRNKPSTPRKPNRPPAKGGGAPKGIKQASREQSAPQHQFQMRGSSNYRGGRFRGRGQG